MLISSILTNSVVKKSLHSKEEEYITILASNTTFKKRQVKKGEVLATVEIFTFFVMEITFLLCFLVPGANHNSKKANFHKKC